MQPRRDFWWCGERVDQVMKRGWGGSSFGGAVGEGCLERGVVEKKEVAEEDLEVA